MGRQKSRVRPDYASIEQAWLQGGELDVVRAAIHKYAQVIDVTESGRDMKPLITGLFDAIDRYKALEAANGGDDGTALASILREAEEALAHG